MSGKPYAFHLFNLDSEDSDGFNADEEAEIAAFDADDSYDIWKPGRAGHHTAWPVGMAERKMGDAVYMKDDFRKYKGSDENTWPPH
jgi:hypothetical protein